MSPARTGSVGASAAPSTIAAPSESPSTAVPNSATAPIVSGMAMASRRATEPHERQRSGRSSFRPAENSAMITASSAARSTVWASSTGSSQPRFSTPTAIAPATPSAR